MILAAAAALALSTGVAFAESGENWEWAYSPNVPAHTTQPAQPQAAQPNTQGAAIYHSNTQRYDTQDSYSNGPLNQGQG